MATEHVNIADPYIHEPKGIATAIASQVYTADGLGTGSWETPTPPFDPSTIKIETVLETFSTLSSQVPVSLGDSIQISFGDGVNGPTDPVMVDAAGTVTFNEAGAYWLVVTGQYGRDGGGGAQAVIFTRTVVNSVVGATSKAAAMDDQDIRLPFLSEDWFTVAAGTTLEYELLASSLGGDVGGLYEIDPIEAGWTNAPSVTLKIARLTT